MDEVFRFVHLRAPQQPREFRFTGLTLANTDFLARIVLLRDADDGDEQVESVLDAFLDTSQFDPEPAALPGATTFFALGEAFRRSLPLTREDARAFVSEIAGRSAGSLVDDAQTAELARRASDTILALKLRSRSAPSVLSPYVTLYRAIDAVRHVALGPAEETIDLAALMRRTVVVPKHAQAQLLVARIDIDALRAAVPEGESHEAVVAEIVGLRRARDEILAFRARDLEVRTEPSGGGASANAPLVLNAEALSALSPATIEALSNASLNPASDSVRNMVERLNRMARRRNRELATVPAISGRRLTIGTTTLPANAGNPLLPAFDLDLTQGDVPAVPDTVGLVRPCGIGDLLVTRQHIIRYEAEEIGLVQNVMQSEQHSRETRRLERTEESLTTEVETTREEERAFQQTDRFEISRNAKDVIKEDDTLKRGVTVSGGYGKFIQTEVSVSQETATAQESAAESAAKYARDLSERAVTKLSERVREQRTLTVLREFEEKVAHGFDNTGGEGHISGIYQWLRKVYEAQVFNYGIRMFVCIMVPEPGAFFLQALAAQRQAGNGITEPPAFNLSPGDIDETNYLDHALTFEASGLEPPPAEFTTSSVTLAPNPDPENPNSITIRLTGEISVPPDYTATSVYFRMSWYKKFVLPAVTPEPQPEMAMHLGQRQALLDLTVLGNDEHAPNSMNDTYTLNDETGAVPYAIVLHAVAQPVILMEMECTRSAEAMDAWRLRTFEKLAQASEQQRSEYANRLAESEATLGAGLPERAPFQNRAIERGELKRNAISILTGQYFTAFNAILESGVQEARVDFDEALAEGEYIRFFETAFEWENMTYEFFDYFWARRSTWVQKLVEIEDPDPDFKAFLTAGYALLTVPILPNFEAAAVHYFENAEIWKGGELPPVTNPDYAAYLTEIAARRAEEPDTEIAVGDPFEIEAPTTLVMLRQSQTLPAWARDEDGAFVPVEPE